MSVIIDCMVNEEITQKLDELKIQYFKSFNMEMLYSPVNTHPDMQIHFIDAKNAIVAPFAYEYYRNILDGDITLIKGDKNPGSTYPTDCAYNIAVMGKKVIGNLKYIDKKIRETYELKGFEFIDVKQGYTKCNLCIVDEKAAITEDEGLFKTLTDAGFDVLKIKPGNIKMQMFDHGFIGGASGFIAPDKLAFLGDITAHADFPAIKNFIEERKINIIKLSSTKLEDFGSILYFN